MAETLATYELIQHLCDALEHEYATQDEWWDAARMKHYGMAPDSRRKAVAIKALATAYGYRLFTHDDGGVGYEFDAELAEKQGIPRARWPEGALGGDERCRCR
jgi:hypothetical protein